MQLLTRAACVLALASLGGCSALYDFGRFHVERDGGLDASTDAAPLDAGDAGPDAAADASLDASDASLDGGVWTLDGFATRLANAACNKAVRCEGKLGAIGAFEIFCHPHGRELIAAQLGLSYPGATVDRAMADTCLALLEGPDCAFGGDLSACGVTIRGALPAGAACDPLGRGADCASADCVGSSCPVCAARGELGDPCDGPSDPPCRSPYTCEGGTCTSFLSLGDPCSNGGCGAGLWCAGATTPTCQPLPNVGEPCNLLFLNIDPCRGSLVCHGGICVDGGGDGATCGGPSDVPCRPGYRCGPTNVCVPLVGPGGACLSRANCPAAFECVGMVCTPLPGIGEACSPTLPCMEGGCVAGTCARLADGAHCPNVIEPFYDQIRASLLPEVECAHWCDGTLCQPFTANGSSCSASTTCEPSSHCVDMGGGGLCTACP